MIESGGSFGFALEAAESLRILRDIIRQELEGDKSTEFDILGLIDDAHPAATEFLDDAVVRDDLAEHRGKSYVGETGKSMKAVELSVCQKDRWRNIAISLTMPESAHHWVAHRAASVFLS